jgi:uncharacterized membrane protein
MWWWHGDGGWSWLLMVAWMALFWGGVLWAFATMLRPRPAKDDPDTVLRRRLASGEIDEAEFARVRALVNEPHARS